MARITNHRRPAWQPYAAAEIDWSHPASDSLRFFIVNAGGNLVDLVTGARGAPSGGAGVINYAGARGDIAAKLASATSDYYSFANDNSWNITGELSLSWCGMIATGGAYRQLCGKQDPGAPSGSNNNPFDFGTDNSASPRPILTRSTNVGTFSQWVAGPGIPLGSPHSCAVAQSGDLSQQGRLYLDGVQVTSGSPHGTSGSVAANTGPLTVGRRADGVTQMDGFTEYVAGWARMLSAAEFLWFHEEPYAMVLWPRRRLYFGAAATPSTFLPSPVVIQQSVNRASTF